MIAKILLAVIALVVGVGGIWLLFLGVGGTGQPAPGRNGATGSCRGSSSARPSLLLAVFLVYPAAGTILRSFQDDKGQFTLANYAVMVEPEFTADPAQQRHLADRRHRRQRGPRTHHRRAVRSRPARVAGQDVRLPAAGDLARRRIGHLGLRLRLAARRPAADRTPERGRGRPRRRADPVADDQPDQHLLRDRDPGLAPDRVRDGRLLGGDQGRVGRGPRGGPARRRLRAPALPRA